MRPCLPIILPKLSVRGPEGSVNINFEENNESLYLRRDEDWKNKEGKNDGITDCDKTVIYLHLDTFKVKLNLKFEKWRSLTERMEIQNLKQLPWEMEKLHKSWAASRQLSSLKNNCFRGSPFSLRWYIQSVQLLLHSQLMWKVTTLLVNIDILTRNSKCIRVIL